MWRRTLALGLLRAWLAFVVSSLLIGLLLIAWDGDNPLESRELYVIGFIGGIIGAVMATICTIAERICGNLAWSTVCYFVVLMAWCAFLKVIAMTAIGEGAWAINLFVAVSFIAGITSWPLFLRPPSGITVYLVSIAGLGMFALYGIAVFHRSLGSLP